MSTWEFKKEYQEGIFNSHVDIHVELLRKLPTFVTLPTFEVHFIPCCYVAPISGPTQGPTIVPQSEVRRRHKDQVENIPHARRASTS